MKLFKTAKRHQDKAESNPREEEDGGDGAGAPPDEAGGVGVGVRGGKPGADRGRERRVGHFDLAALGTLSFVSLNLQDFKF